MCYYIMLILCYITIYYYRALLSEVLVSLAPKVLASLVPGIFNFSCLARTSLTPWWSKTAQKN